MSVAIFTRRPGQARPITNSVFNFHTDCYYYSLCIVIIIHFVLYLHNTDYRCTIN